MEGLALGRLERGAVEARVLCGDALLGAEGKDVDVPEGIGEGIGEGNGEGIGRSRKDSEDAYRK